MKSEFCKKCGKNFEKAFKKLKFIGEFPENVDDPAYYYVCPHKKFFLNHIFEGTVEIKRPDWYKENVN